MNDTLNSRWRNGRNETNGRTLRLRISARETPVERPAIRPNLPISCHWRLPRGNSKPESTTIRLILPIPPARVQRVEFSFGVGPRLWGSA